MNERPNVASIDDAMAWAHDQVWRFDGDFDCRQTVKRLMFASWLHERGGLTDNGPSPVDVTRARVWPELEGEGF